MAARSFAIERGAVELHARWMPPAGARRAPVLVFLHDSLGSVALWRDFPDRLARALGLGCLAYDRRGQAPPRRSVPTRAETDLRARLARQHGAKAEALAAAWLDTWTSPEFRCWTVEEELTRIRCPVLVVQGDLDEYGTEAQLRVVAERVAGPTRTRLLPGVRHTAHRDAPEQVVEIVSGFLREHAA